MSCRHFPLPLVVQNVRGEDGLSVRRSLGSAHRLFLVIEGVPSVIRTDRAADIMAKVGVTRVLDDRLEFVFEALLVVCCTVLIEVESMVDDNRGFILSAIVVETLELDDEDFRSVGDLLGFLGIAELLASITAVALNSLIDVLVKVLGDRSLGNLGRDCNGEAGVLVALGARLVTAFSAGHDTAGDNLGSSFEHRKDSECTASVWYILMCQWYLLGGKLGPEDLEYIQCLLVRVRMAVARVWSPADFSNS